MTIDPAAISASLGVTTIEVESIAPDSPAARAKGTVKPSDVPMTMSRTDLPDVKCCSTCGVNATKVVNVAGREEAAHFPAAAAGVVGRALSAGTE